MLIILDNFERKLKSQSLKLWFTVVSAFHSRNTFYALFLTILKESPKVLSYGSEWVNAFDSRSTFNACSFHKSECVV